MDAVPGIHADNSSQGLKSQLHEVWDSLGSVGSNLSDDEWRYATPCPGWDVAAQYAHVVGTESSILGRPSPDAEPGSPGHVRNQIGAFNEVWVAALSSESRTAVLERFEEVTSARRQELAKMTEADFSAPSWTPVGQADYRRFMQIRVFDCWVHLQDVRGAVSRPGDESGAVAEQAIDEIARALGFIVGKKAAAGEGSSVDFVLRGPLERTLRVAVIDGRASLVAPDGGSALATISLGSIAFSRVACGRVPYQDVLSGGLGGVELSGDSDLGRRVLENLAFTI